MPYAPVHVENPRDVDATVIVGHCAEVRSKNMWMRPEGAPIGSGWTDFAGNAQAYAIPAGGTLDTVPWLDSGCAEGAALPLYVLVGTEVTALSAAWTGPGWSARLDPGAGTPLRRDDLQALFASDPGGASDLWLFASLAGAWAEAGKAGRCVSGATPAVFDVAATVPLTREPIPLGTALAVPATGVRRDRRAAGGKCIPGTGRAVSEIWPTNLAIGPANVLVRACDQVAVLTDRHHLLKMAEGWDLALAGISNFAVWGLPFALDPACPVTLAKRHVTYSVTYVAGPYTPTGQILVIPADDRWHLATPEEDAALETWPGWAAFTKL